MMDIGDIKDQRVRNAHPATCFVRSRVFNIVDASIWMGVCVSVLERTEICVYFL